MARCVQADRDVGVGYPSPAKSLPDTLVCACNRVIDWLLGFERGVVWSGHRWAAHRVWAGARHHGWKQCDRTCSEYVYAIAVVPSIRRARVAEKIASGRVFDLDSGSHVHVLARQHAHAGPNTACDHAER